MADEIVLPPPVHRAPASAGDDVDEFAGIEPPRRMRSPLLALLGVALAGYLLYHLRFDLTYWLSSYTRAPTPEQLGSARDVATHLPPPNTYVTLAGMPDRSNAAMLDTRGKDEYRQFFRLLGTDSRLLILRTFGQVPNSRTLADRFTGRLIAFSDLSFADSIRDWFHRRVVATHFFDPILIRKHLGQSSVLLDDLAGDPVHLSADSRLALDFSFPNEYRLNLPRARFATPELALEALALAGFISPVPAPLPVELAPDDTNYLLVGRPLDHMRQQVITALGNLDSRVRIAPNPADPIEVYVLVPKSRYPEGLAQASRALDTLGLRGAAPPPFVFIAKTPPGQRDVVLENVEALRAGISVEARAETLERTWSEWQRDRALDFTRVARIKLIEPLLIPESAQVLVEGDDPASYWYVPVMVVLLVLFLTFNLYALKEALGRPRPPSAPEPRPA